MQLFFVDCENEGELEHSFFDLKMQLVESKALLQTAPKVKLVCYTHEQQLIAIHTRALALGIDLSQVPTALYAHDLHGDLAHHLGTTGGT